MMDPLEQPAPTSDDPPWVSFDEVLDEQYPPGSVERINFDANVARLRRRHNRLNFLFAPLLKMGPRWQDEAGNGHGVGHIAYVFWYELVETLIDDRDLGYAFYNTLDSLAFHYLDDAYVPTLDDVRKRVAGRRQRNWQARRAAGHAQAEAAMADIDAWHEAHPEA